MYNDGDTQNNLASDILKDTEGNPGANSITMTWAEANGRLNTANSQNWDIPSQATNTGATPIEERVEKTNREAGVCRIVGNYP